MKAIVFGSTGFIGSHVVEQIQASGHEVTAAVRATSQTTFLEELEVPIVRIDFSDAESIRSAIVGHDVVYNCTADANLQTRISMEAEVEIQLARKLVEAAGQAGASRFVQLSTIVVYDFRSDQPMDETYISHPEYPIQSLGLERERVVVETGRTAGIETILLRPASTIGPRDKSSFFARLFAARSKDQYPVAGASQGQVSFVDTRDIGRAMAWLGTFQKPVADNGLYLLKGFDTTWDQLKHEMDALTGSVAGTVEIAETGPTSFMYKSMTVNRLWDDQKIRTLGFETKYSFSDTVETAIRDLISRDPSFIS